MRYNCYGPEFWEQAAVEIPNDQLAELICGLAYVETKFRWVGGSFSGVIWLFRSLVARNVSVELLDEVSGWVLANSKNPYNPFGTYSSLGARNYSEYRALSLERAVQIENRIADDKLTEGRAKAEREVLRKMAAAGAAVRGTEARAEVIESMNGLPLSKKLERIASDPHYLPQFFPTSIAGSVKQSDIDALSEDVCLELAWRLKGKRKGPWGRFRKRLLVSIGPVWNTKQWCV